MTTPSDPDKPETREPSGSNPSADAPFDPYRFGKPEHPIPAEYAPPGYSGPVIPETAPSPYTAPNPWAAPSNQAQNPFSNPPGTPYAPPPGQYPSPGPGVPGQFPGPYGAPPPPPYYGYTAQKSSNGKAVAGLVLGILSIVFCWLIFFDAAFVILGLIFALLALSESKRPGGSGRGMAVAGLMCSIVGAILATILTVLIVNAANKCGGFSNSDAPGFERCVRDHF